MTTNSITQLIRGAPILQSTDSVRRAAGLIRASDGTKLLVIKNGAIRGTISERSIAAYLAVADDREKSLNDPIDPLIEEYPMHINASVSLQEAAQVFASSGVDMLPVIDSDSGFRGVLYRRDVVGLLTNNLRPPSVAGMATPLGVYLTTGSLSGGAGSLGLYLTGVSLGSMTILGGLAAQGVMRLFGLLTGIRVSAYLASPPITTGFSVYDIPSYALAVLSIAFFALMMRLSPLSGYHAAEHMTVHAIEAGEDITPETVKIFPRVHPRCGTNLLAGASVFIIITSTFGGQMAALIAILLVILGWRAIGGWMQAVVTTKTPNERQLRSGVAAGNELLKRYQEQPYYQVYGFNRIWHMGFLQTLAGMGTVLYIAYLLLRFTKLPIPF